MFSCGKEKATNAGEVIASGDLKKIREFRTNLVAEIDRLNADLNTLDVAIGELDPSTKFPLVTVQTLKDTAYNHYVSLLGSVSTEKNLVINSEYPGTLLDVYVKRGDKVSKGQLIARIDDGGLSSQLAQLEVQANLAKTTFDRQARLWEQRIGSEIQYLQAKAQFESASNAVTQLKQQLDKTRITAPFSGAIDEIFTEKGTVVGQGTPMFRLVDLSEMRIEVEVPEIYLNSVKKGTQVRAWFPVLNREMETKVRQVSNYINPDNRSFKIQIEVPNTEGDIKPNLNARVYLNDYTNENAILIPSSVITENAEGDQYIYLATELSDEGEAIARQRIVTTGKAQEGLVEVTSGVEPGDKLIIEGARSLREGQQIKVIR